MSHRMNLIAEPSQMRQRISRRGSVARTVLVIAFMLMAVPLILMSIALIGYRVSSVQADELRRARAAEARAVRNHQYAKESQIQPVPVKSTTFGSGPESPANESRSTWQKVSETHFQRELKPVEVETVDPVSGEAKVTKRMESRLVPVTTTRYVQSFAATAHDPAVTQLAQELRELDQDDDSYRRKIDQLRKRLDLEFDEMHEAQAKEISQAEERLGSLKKLHEQRQDNKDKIVQRRVDELLGRSDALRWDVRSSQQAGSAQNAAQHSAVRRGASVGGPVSPYQPSLTIRSSTQSGSVPRPQYGFQATDAGALSALSPGFSSQQLPAPAKPPQIASSPENPARPQGFGVPPTAPQLARRGLVPSAPGQPQSQPIGASSPRPPTPPEIAPDRAPRPQITRTQVMIPGTADPRANRSAATRNPMLRQATATNRGPSRSNSATFDSNDERAGAFDATSPRQNPNSFDDLDGGRISNQRDEMFAGPPGNTIGSGPPATTSNSANASIARLFDLVRNIGRSNAIIRSAELEVSQKQKLHSKRAISELELRKAELQLENITREVELRRIELEGLASSLKRDLTSAQSQYENAMESKNLTQELFQQGSITQQKLLNATRDVNSARKALDDAKASLDQLTRATAIISRDIEKESVRRKRRVNLNQIDLDTNGDASLDIDVRVVDPNNPAIVDRIQEAEVKIEIERTEEFDTGSAEEEPSGNEISEEEVEIAPDDDSPAVDVVELEEELEVEADDSLRPAVTEEEVTGLDESDSQKTP